MPDFSYYGTFDESITILRDLVEQCRVTLIPDLGAFPEPLAPSYDAVTDEVFKQLRRRRVLFLAGSFTRHPPKMRRLEAGPNAGSYYISIPEGGPLIQMTLATVNIVDGQPTLISGMVSQQKLYVDPVTGLSEPASPEVRQAFKEIVRTMKKRLVPYQLAMKIWISREALRLLQSGKARIIDRGVLYGPRDYGDSGK
jgi:hypothetical protein